MACDSRLDFLDEKSRPLPIIGMRAAIVQCGPHDDARLAFPSRLAAPVPAKERWNHFTVGGGAGRMAGNAENGGPPAPNHCHAGWQDLSVPRIIGN
jgi:hypothetical protein